MKPTTEMMYAALQAAERLNARKPAIKLGFQDIHDILAAALDAEPSLVIDDCGCTSGTCSAGKRLSVG